jgi:uncharacterized repeat protein (TIGR01451 family)
MKFFKNTNPVILLCVMSFQLTAQQVNTTFKFYSDVNGDCIRQPNEQPFYPWTFMSNYFVFQGANMYKSGAYNWAGDSLNVSLDINQAYSFALGFNSNDSFKFNCGTNNYRYFFTIGNAPISIDIPFNDTLSFQNYVRQMVNINSQDIDTNRIYCVNDTLNFSLTEFTKNSGSSKFILDWGDAKIDTIDASQNAFYFLNTAHVYNTIGNFKFILKLKTINNTFSLDAFTIKINTCAIFSGRAYLDKNTNCIDNAELGVKNRIFSILDSASNIQKYSGGTDINGNFNLSISKNGSYKFVWQDSFKLMNCRDGKLSNGQHFVSFKMLGLSNTIKNIPTIDTAFIKSKSLNYLSDKFLCYNNFASCVSSIVYIGDSIQRIVDWRDGIKDTLIKSNTLSTIITDLYSHQYKSIGKFKPLVKFFYKGIQIDSLFLDTFTIENCSGIKGKVFLDINNNCVYNPSDTILRRYRISLLDSNYKYLTSTFSSDSGTYFLNAPSMRKVILKITNDSVNCISTSPFLPIITDSSGYVIQDIPIDNSKLDYSIYLGGNIVAFPGDSSKIHFFYYSLLPNSKAKFHFILPPKSSLIRANNFSYLNIIGNNVYVNFVGNNFYNNYIVIKHDTTVTIGDTFCYQARLFRVNNEQDTTNNITSFCLPAMASYDPNDKQVAIQSMQDNGSYTDKNDDLIYTIRFQNTGTAPAKNIFIMDTFDTKLEMSSFTIIGSSHTMTPIQYPYDSNIIRFSFLNINLIDKSTNEALSNGFVTFKIKAKSNLQLEQTISNKASIYFDFNIPIVTNIIASKYALKYLRKTKTNPLILSGVVYIDVDKNCIYDKSIDKPLPNTKIEILDTNLKVIKNIFSDNKSEYTYIDSTHTKLNIRFAKAVKCGPNTVLINLKDSINYSITQNFILDTLINIQNRIGNIFINQFRFYPNPVKDFLHFESNVIESKYLITTISGKHISSGLFVENINVSALENGLYFLVIEIKDLKWNLKFVKE